MFYGTLIVNQEAKPSEFNACDNIATFVIPGKSIKLLAAQCKKIITGKDAPEPYAAAAIVIALSHGKSVILYNESYELNSVYDKIMQITNGLNLSLIVEVDAPNEGPATVKFKESATSEAFDKLEDLEAYVKANYSDSKEE